jgi:hypothetical protein
MCMHLLAKSPRAQHDGQAGGHSTLARQLPMQTVILHKNMLAYGARGVLGHLRPLVPVSTLAELSDSIENSQTGLKI